MNYFLVYATIILGLVAFSSAKEVCYDELGCFTTDKPFGGTLARPIAVLPESPEKIAVKFTLYKRNNNPLGERIGYASMPSSYDASIRTIFITHGFLHHANKEWVLDMKDALLSVENANVITVDWSKGNGLPYTQATANTQVVGAEIARLINNIIKGYSEAKAANFYLIGHSLGAHISGYAGSRINGLGRITGLDPAGPYFENTDPIVRLDPTDALYVDAIHTDGAATIQIGLGLMQPVGHADFYPNGGKQQPECPKTSGKLLGAVFNLLTLDVSGVEDSVSCNHQAAVTYFTQSIRDSNCMFTSFPCQSQDDYDKGNCIVCSSSGCNHLGYWSSPKNDKGSLYVNTLSPLKNSFCLQPYKIKLVSDTKYNQARGTFKIYLRSASQSTPALILDNSESTFKSGSTETRLLSFAETRIVNTIESVFVSYTKTTNFFSGWLYDESWSFKSIEIFSGDNQINSKFCPTTNVIQSSYVEFKKC